MLAIMCNMNIGTDVKLAQYGCGAGAAKDMERMHYTPAEHLCIPLSSNNIQEEVSPGPVIALHDSTAIQHVVRVPPGCHPAAMCCGR